MKHIQKTAIVTGASRGIGAAIALRLAEDGHAVVVNFASNAAAAQAVVEQIEAQGGTATALQADISDPKAARALFDAAEDRFGPADILVNNAGIMRNAAIATATDADFDQQCAINIGGPFRCMREAASRLRDGGRIISISSSVVGLYQPSYGLYAATKAATEALSHVLAKELGSRGITVNSVAPGPVATELFLEGKPDELIRAITGSIPLGRLGTVDDIAAVVSFLAGPDGRWVNGQTIRANGGVI
ncbi:MAG: 3-ketoacyl-ACP reductase [Alphaproteobacteria bacterium MedPE-SWcel]|nr:MAG: 3-ketoacyl-ACP reductase [Alphaproteobacteria bacterium MedPE-SWcel]